MNIRDFAKTHGVKGNGVAAFINRTPEIKAHTQKTENGVELDDEAVRMLEEKKYPNRVEVVEEPKTEKKPVAKKPAAKKTSAKKPAKKTVKKPAQKKTKATTKKADKAIKKAATKKTAAKTTTKTSAKSTKSNTKRKATATKKQPKTNRLPKTDNYKDLISDLRKENTGLRREITALQKREESYKRLLSTINKDINKMI